MAKQWLVIIFFFTSCSSDTETIKIKGSDTEVNLAARLAENFHQQNNDFNISVSGGGSGLDIASLLNGQADIANSSRALNNNEINLFKKRNIAIETLAFAEDAIAFVVTENFPLDSLTAEQLANILSGKYENWQLITGANTPVNIYGRQVIQAPMGL